MYGQGLATFGTTLAATSATQIIGHFPLQLSGKNDH